MTSDDARRHADVPYKPAGPGLYMTFRCAACGIVRGCVGRKLRRVMGLRQFVCAKCAEVRK